MNFYCLGQQKNIVQPSEKIIESEKPKNSEISEGDQNQAASSRMVLNQPTAIDEPADLVMLAGSSRSSRSAAPKLPNTITTTKDTPVVVAAASAASESRSKAGTPDDNLEPHVAFTTLTEETSSQEVFLSASETGLEKEERQREELERETRDEEEREILREAARPMKRKLMMDTGEDAELNQIMDITRVVQDSDEEPFKSRFVRLK